VITDLMSGQHDGVDPDRVEWAGRRLFARTPAEHAKNVAAWLAEVFGGQAT
jgi:hypothetical protein